MFDRLPTFKTQFNRWPTINRWTSIILLSSLLSANVAWCQPTFVQSPQTKQARENDKNAQILTLVENFRLAIIQKDKAAFLALFFDPSMKWVDVLSDITLAEVANKRPDIGKVTTGGPLEFIDDIVTDNQHLEEKFYNLNIESDGDIASVIFDYEFFEEDFKTNWGKEAWQLARTEKGWKITSIVFSVTLNPKRHSRQKG